MPEHIRKGASLSDCGLYRYRLVRIWDEALPILGFCLLNPSTADAEIDDPTVRKCVGFGERFGYGGIAIGNAYALRATDPRDLKASIRRGVDPWADNDDHLAWLAHTCPTVIVGWGQGILSSLHGRHTLRQLDACPNVLCLAVTEDGHPGHPLYLPNSTTPKPFDGAAYR